MSPFTTPQPPKWGAFKNLSQILSPPFGGFRGLIFPFGEFRGVENRGLKIRSGIKT